MRWSAPRCGSYDTPLKTGCLPAPGKVRQTAPRKPFRPAGQIRPNDRIGGAFLFPGVQHFQDAAQIVFAGRTANLLGDDKGKLAVASLPKAPGAECIFLEFGAAAICEFLLDLKPRDNARHA